jgi:hypothetical protein
MTFRNLTNPQPIRVNGQHQLAIQYDPETGQVVTLPPFDNSIDVSSPPQFLGEQPPKATYDRGDYQSDSDPATWELREPV